MTRVLEDKYSAAATQQLLAKASFIDPRYRDGNPGDDVEDALLEEMLAVRRQKSGTMTRMEMVPCSPVPRRLEMEKEQVHHLRLPKK